jgi:hypothetical protein
MQQSNQLRKRLGLRLWCLKTGRGRKLWCLKTGIGWKLFLRWGVRGSGLVGLVVDVKNADTGLYHVKFDDEEEGEFTGDNHASLAF